MNSLLRRSRAVILALPILWSPVGAAPNADRLAADLGKAWDILNAGEHAKTVTFVDGVMDTIQDETRAEARRMVGFAPVGRETDYHRVKDQQLAALGFEAAGDRYHPSFWTTAADYLANRKKFAAPAAKD